MIKIEKVSSKIVILYLNRPEKLNAMNFKFWGKLPEVIEELENNPKISVVIIAGEGRAFSAGLDIKDFAINFKENIIAETHIQREALYKQILLMQKGFDMMANGKKIYISAVHGVCIGGGLDMISATDLRFCSKDAIFSLREIKLGIVADLGSLNRLPYIIGESNTKLLAYTGKDINSTEALRIGLVNTIYENKDELLKNVIKTARDIAINDKKVLSGIKDVLDYNLKHSIDDSLNYVALRNSSFLNTDGFKFLLKSKL